MRGHTIKFPNCFNLKKVFLRVSTVFDQISNKIEYQLDLKGEADIISFYSSHP